MNLIVNAQHYSDPSPLNKAGGEGELYALNSQNVAKVYFEKLLIDEPWRTNKVLALCNTFENSGASRMSGSVAFPEHPAYRELVSPSTLVGFSMRWFKECPVIRDLKFDIKNSSYREEKGIQLDDSSALNFVYSIFATIDQIHAARIVLGDVNDGNILFNPNTRSPVIIDIDSAQLAGWPCPMTQPSYSDPLLDNRPRNLKGGLTYDTGTDIFALAVVCFEFIIGLRPYQVRVTPASPDGEVENKLRGISSIRCFEVGRDFLHNTGVSYVDCAPNRAVETRLAWLKLADPRLYQFFVATFVHGERESLLLSLPLTDARHPGNRFLVESGAKTIIDDIARKRARQAAVRRNQGAATQRAALPDSGARKVVESIIARTGSVQVSTAATLPQSKTPLQATTADPAGFGVFLKQFDLGI